MTGWTKETILTGSSVELQPLSVDHRDELIDAIDDGQLSALWYTAIPDKNNIDIYLNTALTNRINHSAQPFIVRHKVTGKLIGATRYCHIDNANKRLEIGYTWYSKTYQGTSINTECKLLLLQHAFETLGAIAVEFRTHWFNQASRNAILRIGAKQDGVLRNHQQSSDGSYRDTVVFSIINTEWLSVRNHLEFLLTKYNH